MTPAELDQWDADITAAEERDEAAGIFNEDTETERAAWVTAFNAWNGGRS